MDQQTSTTLLAGLSRPGTCHARGDDLYLQVDGSVAGQAATIALGLSDAHRQGFPPQLAHRIARAFGTWLEPCGAFPASVLADEDRDPEHTGDLTVTAVNTSARLGPSPRPSSSHRVVSKTITVLIPAASPRLAQAPA